ncbi:energy transducer TonB [Sediminicoccus sp. KRV36]|uniref:energy transducer TonB n=1 Tax=Sediminicoccus sp. KRV36 TaxID=3133721 RepID=UPI00200E8DD1|nr:energy transducer TonB [Sediminicoccus rosea]UPY38789.1 TonB family protein [Sediminicoccus rosea]
MPAVRQNRLPGGATGASLALHLGAGLWLALGSPPQGGRPQPERVVEMAFMALPDASEAVDATAAGATLSEALPEEPALVEAAPEPTASEAAPSPAPPTPHSADAEPQPQAPEIQQAALPEQAAPPPMAEHADLQEPTPPPQEAEPAAATPQPVAAIPPRPTPPPLAANPPVPRPARPASAPARAASRRLPREATPSGAPEAAMAPPVATPAAFGPPPLITQARYRHPPTPPAYPPRALSFGVSGTVLVRALVGADGETRELRLHRSSGHAELDHAALSAVRGWAFAAATQGGQPIEAWVEVPVRFRLDD